MIYTKESTYSLSVIKESIQDTGIFAGYGSVFNVLDLSGDVVLPGAFSKTLAMHRERGSMPAMMASHGDGSDWPIGTWEDIREDERGLRVSGRLNLDLQKGREALSLLKAGALSGMSIGCMLPKTGWDWGTTADGIRARNIKELDLWEISLVTFPANRAARVEIVKSLDQTKAMEFIALCDNFRINQEA